MVLSKVIHPNERTYVMLLYCKLSDASSPCENRRMEFGAPHSLAEKGYRAHTDGCYKSLLMQVTTTTLSASSPLLLLACLLFVAVATWKNVKFMHHIHYVNRRVLQWKPYSRGFWWKNIILKWDLCASDNSLWFWQKKILRNHFNTNETKNPCQKRDSTTKGVGATFVETSESSWDVVDICLNVHLLIHHCSALHCMYAINFTAVWQTQR